MLLPTCDLEGEGRPQTVSASTGQNLNPVTATSYNVASLATGVTFGSGNTDAFTYDPKTDRMTNYQYNANGQSETGAVIGTRTALSEVLRLRTPLTVGTHRPARIRMTIWFALQA
jgi:hypothetical protein